MRAYRIYHEPHVHKWVKQLTVDFANWFLEEVGLDHQITIRLYAAGSLDPGNGLAMACFGLRRDKPCIWVATWWYFWREDGRVKDRKEAREEILDSLAHEFVHYDKWRRGLPRNHRGLQQRVNALIRRFNDETVA